MHLKSRIGRRSVVAAGLAALLSVSVAACGSGGGGSSAQAKPTLNMGVFPALRPLELVRSQHLLENMGYQVNWHDFIQGAPAEASAMASGSVDIIEADTSGLEQVAAKSPGLIWYIANGATNYVAIVAKKGSGINSLADLRGKTVGGVVPNTAPTAVLQMGLAQHGLTLDDVHGINVVGPSQPAAIQNGGFDAATSYVPYSTQMLTDGSATLLTTASDVYGSTWLGGGIAVRPEFAKEHQQAVVDVVRAVRQAEDMLKNNPDKAYQALAQETKTSLENIKYSYDKGLVGTVDVTPDRQGILKQTEILVKYGVIKVPDAQKFVDDLVHPEFAEKAAQG